MALTPAQPSAPPGQQLEYGIIAVNTGGNSLSSNTVAVVL